MKPHEPGRRPFRYVDFANDINEILLADIALKIQLTPTEHAEAVEHYGAIEKWLERDESPVEGKVLRLYPQGSVAIHATISSAQDKEEFDIDLVVELDVPADTDPEEVLDLLFDAVRGKPGSRYYDVTKRNSRCVTVHYKNMHLDLCPAVLHPELLARTSTMFHHNKERAEKYRHIRNPWGFAEWFNGSMPDERDFAAFYSERGLMVFKADAEPVPDPTPVYQKPRRVVGLQLVKRFRNHRYSKRTRKGPPSVVLSKLAADAPLNPGGLLDEIETQARHLEQIMVAYRIEVRNPRCPEHDVLTDRWPPTEAEQQEFYRDVRFLQERLQALRSAKELREKQAILNELFGERATLAAFDALQRRFDELANSGEVKVNPATAGIAAAASGLASKPLSSPAVISAPHHYSHASAKGRCKD